MVKPGSSSPIPPYTIIEIDNPLLTFEEAWALPLPPTPPELIRRMFPFRPEEDDVDR